MWNAVEVPARKRPAGVWVICIYCFLMAGWILLSLLMVYPAAASLTPHEKGYVATITTTDYKLSTISAALTLSAAVALFLLWRMAGSLFGAALGASTTFMIWHIDQLSAAGLASVVGGVGWMIMLVVCILYTARLKAKGILE